MSCEFVCICSSHLYAAAATASNPTNAKILHHFYSAVRCKDIIVDFKDLTLQRASWYAYDMTGLHLIRDSMLLGGSILKQIHSSLGRRYRQFTTSSDQLCVSESRVSRWNPGISVVSSLRCYRLLCSFESWAITHCDTLIISSPKWPMQLWNLSSDIYHSIKRCVTRCRDALNRITLCICLITQWGMQLWWSGNRYGKEYKWLRFIPGVYRYVSLNRTSRE